MIYCIGNLPSLFCSLLDSRSHLIRPCQLRYDVIHDFTLLGRLLAFIFVLLEGLNDECGNPLVLLEGDLDLLLVRLDRLLRSALILGIFLCLKSEKFILELVGLGAVRHAALNHLFIDSDLVLFELNIALYDVDVRRPEQAASLLNVSWSDDRVSMQPSHGLRQTNQRLELSDSVAVSGRALAARALPQFLVLVSQNGCGFANELRPNCAAHLDIGLELGH